METYNAIRACAELILSGEVLQASGVTAGRGMVIDWRTVTSGETLRDGADAFDAAELFVSLVGADAALALAAGAATPVPAFVAPAPHITAWMRGPNGGRRREFQIGEFTVKIEPHEDDEKQAAFTARLAELASSLNLF